MPRRHRLRHPDHRGAGLSTDASRVLSLPITLPIGAHASTVHVFLFTVRDGSDRVALRLDDLLAATVAIRHRSSRRSWGRDDERREHDELVTELEVLGRDESVRGEMSRERTDYVAKEGDYRAILGLPVSPVGGPVRARALTAPRS